MAPEYYPLIFIVNAAASLYMLGVIWQVQILQYPQLRLISASVFTEYHTFHTRRISFVVVLPMLMELFTSVILLFMNFDPHYTINITGFVLVVCIWISTFFIQVPLHEKLKTQDGNHAKNVNRLITTNWIRTLLWSVKAGLAIIALFFLFD